MPHLPPTFLASTLLLSAFTPVDTPTACALPSPSSPGPVAVVGHGSNCTGCDLCLASVGTIELLPRPVLIVLDGAMQTAAGICRQIPGPSGKECYAITSRLADVLDYTLQGCNATGVCEAIGYCKATGLPRVGSAEL
jgi:hypothetical protein